MTDDKKGFVISDEDLKKLKDWLRSPEGQKKMMETLEKIKPKSQMEQWSDNYKQALWWAQNKDIPYM